MFLLREKGEGGEFGLRELMIRFIDDGVVFNEIDENRNYYLTEIETIIERIRVRLKNEKRVSAPKEYECYVDGKKLIVTDVRFEGSSTLENQLLQTIEEEGGWSEELKHKYINEITEYAQTEREHMAHREFRAFAIRFDQFMCDPKMKPFPLVLSLEELKQLFDSVHVNISTGFYSQLEEIMASIHEAYLMIVKIAEKEIIEGELDAYDGDLENYLENKVMDWLHAESNFVKFENYTVARYSSVPMSRIHSIYPKARTYQALQEKIFVDYAKAVGFGEAYEVNRGILEEFEDKYTGALFEGFSMRDDDMLDSIIISPIVKRLTNEVDALLSKLEKDEGEDTEELFEDVDMSE